MRKAIKLALVFTAGYQFHKNGDRVIGFVAEKAGKKIGDKLVVWLERDLPKRETRSGYRRFYVAPDADAS